MEYSAEGPLVIVFQFALTKTHESGTAHISGGFLWLVFTEIGIVLDV